MKTITLQVSAKTQKKLDALTAAGEIASVEKYLEELIAQDLEDRQLEELILEGMEGPFTPLDEAAWKEMKQEVQNRIESRRQSNHAEASKVSERPARYRRSR